MKKFILYPILGIFSLLLVLLVTLAGVLFFNPTLLINPQSIDYVLKRTHILKSYSWKEARISHEWITWNERIMRSQFKDLCLEFDGTGLYFTTCINELSWDFRVGWMKGEGIKSITNRPILVRSRYSKIILKETQEPPKKESPPDIWGYWSMLWHSLIPDMDFKLLGNEVITKDQKIDFDFILLKLPQELKAETLGFNLFANPKELVVTAPRKYKVPLKLKLFPELYLYEVKLHAFMKESGIPLELTGSLENILFKVNSTVELPLKESISSLDFRRKAVLATSAEIRVQEIKKAVGTFAPRPFNVLPAPLNSMNGAIKVDVTTHAQDKKEDIAIKALTSIDLKGPDQVFLAGIGTDVLLNLLTFKPQNILVDVDFKKINLKLPRISKKSLPPQFTPDSRIKSKDQLVRELQEKKNPVTETALHLEASQEKSLHMTTDLLDEPLRLNFNLDIDNGQLNQGFVKILPLKTKVFKRPIRIPSMVVRFDYPAKPVLQGQVIFLLPEYKITMDLEGPVSEPRYAFSSRPPLSRDDIYSVLLFGRPLAELDPDDKRAAGQTNQVLAQGIMSLSVLYFLAGSPVEYIGYDPDSKTATAQFRLGSKSSLRVGGDSEGLNSTGIRQSIGKGWYIDTSATNNQKSNSNSAAGNDYGVLLERVIAY